MHHTNVSGDSILQKDTAAVEMMLYICKNCDKSISVPMLKEESEKAFYFRFQPGTIYIFPLKQIMQNSMITFKISWRFIFILTSPSVDLNGNLF